MIRYSLKCADDHGFESWFQSSEAFGGLVKARKVTCPVCGSAEVEKVLMAPAVQPSRAVKPAPDPARALAVPSSKIEEALLTLRRQVQENSEYVGMGFASEARRIHNGEAPERAIYGEAKVEEARRLIEDGVPVAPLPFMPQRKVN
ncbi:DUF1178 family protein [Cereibacter sediminicola]|uniref:DUF1178 family protein n=1 Tax=Cereibacter sediminicola TaxID=2584941 RepID=UPI0011A90B08|nr:DUF1178 family protein [Cereibacter sediminicola]